MYEPEPSRDIPIPLPLDDNFIDNIQDNQDRNIYNDMIIEEVSMVEE